MPFPIRRVVLTLTLVLAASNAARAQSQDKAFHGLYLGVDVGRQNLIGGSLVEGVDTLQQDTRTVLTFYGGLRGQLGSGFVLGGELGYGRLDGDLILSEPSRLLQVEYTTDAQWSWTLTAGHTIPARGRALVFGYVSEVTREFDVNVLLRAVRLEQQDEQGLLRYGVGVEVKVAGPLHLRATFGTSRADFGDRQINITPNKPFEVSGGVVFQF